MDQKIISEIRNKATAYWEDLIGIVMFGSCVKGKRYNDIDLLIVLDEIKKNRVERIGEVVDFKRTLKLRKPVDVILLSRKECFFNFRNHNPLYLDMALDGKVICDDGTLKNLIDETKRYLKKRSIIREGTKWLFPVKRGIASLSKINNKNWAESWLKDAERDLESAQVLYKEKLFEKVVYHSQQCVEKSVKAVLICFGAFEKTHYVSTALRGEMTKRKLKDERIDKLITISENLEPHVSLSRYPGVSDDEIWLPCEEYDDDSAKKSVEDAKKAMKIAEEFINEWFTV